MAGQWTCRDCQYEDNEEGDAECAACGEKRPAAAPVAGGEGDAAGFFVCGLVLTAEAVPGKDRLLKLSVNVGKAAPLTVVTNAPNVHEGSAVVIATVGATVRPGRAPFRLRFSSGFDPLHPWSLSWSPPFFASPRPGGSRTCRVNAAHNLPTSFIIMYSRPLSPIDRCMRRWRASR